MLVLPAPYRIDLVRARAIVGRPDLELATEQQRRRVGAALSAEL